MTESTLHFSLGGVPAGFARPDLLWLTAAAALVGVLLVVAAVRRRRAPVGFASQRLIPRLLVGASRRRSVIRASFTALGLLLCAFALARPQFGGERQTQRRSGIDVVVALDASHSMLASDVAPDRMARAKLELQSLLAQLRGDRVGLVTFASRAFVQMPLTTDYAAAQMFLRAVDPSHMPQGGTDIGGALRMSAELLGRVEHGAKERAVVLISDGEDWGGDALTAAEELEDAGVHLLVVGIGSTTGAPVPLLDQRGAVQGFRRDERGQPIVTRLNRDGLMQLAKAAGGQFFHQPDGVAMGAVSRYIGGLQKSDLDDVTVIAYTERYQPFVLAGLIFLVLGAATSAAVGRQRLRGGAGATAAGAVLLLLAGTARADSLFQREDEAVARGNRAFSEERYDEALNAYGSATPRRDDSHVVEFDRGAALHKLGRHAEATEAFSRAAEEGDATFRSLAEYNRGTARAAAGDKQSALAAYRRALLLNPSNASARHNLEVLLAPPDQQENEQQKSEQQKSEQQKDQSEQGGEGQQKEDQPQPGEGESENEQQQGAGSAESGEKQQSEGQQRAGSDNPGERERKDGQDSKEQTGNEPGAREEREGETAAQLDARAHPKSDGERLLDAVQMNEQGLPMWRLQDHAPARKADGNEW